VDGPCEPLVTMLNTRRPLPDAPTVGVLYHRQCICTGSRVKGRTVARETQRFILVRAS
jgi:hypothetical protein